MEKLSDLPKVIEEVSDRLWIKTFETESTLAKWIVELT